MTAITRDGRGGHDAWKLVGLRAIVFAGPWVLDHASPDERARLLGAQPLLLRVLYRFALRPRYERLVRPLRAADHSIHPQPEV